MGSTGVDFILDVWLWEIGGFSVILGLEFFSFLVIGLGDSSGWRRAVSRMAAPRGLVLIHRRIPTEGVVPGPSGDA